MNGKTGEDHDTDIILTPVIKWPNSDFIIEIHLEMIFGLCVFSGSVRKLMSVLIDAVKIIHKGCVAYWTQPTNQW